MLDPSYYGCNIQYNNLFNHVENAQNRAFLQTAHFSITSCELWDWLRNNSNPRNGFLFASSPELDKISEELFKHTINANHSGASYCIIMREMAFIAVNGYEKHVYDCLHASA